MKNLYLLCLIFLVTSLISCSDDDSDNDGPSYEFKNQELQGMIDGQAFVLGEGTVSSSDGELSLKLLSDMETASACDQFGSGDFVRVFFTIAEAEGIVELSFEEQTVTLFNPENTLNIIITEGAVEITSISESSVSGKIDARYDDENFVNGNFTAEFCE